MIRRKIDSEDYSLIHKFIEKKPGIPVNKITPLLDEKDWILLVGTIKTPKFSNQRMRTLWGQEKFTV